ncbi:hypothetical protein [Pseudomonas serbica]|uniref:hypothetical protein n=1 Tax=Pseudomonas serbica TaxID=2965074 RepID=UPI00237C1824|nr:hypothetical protein [Pseudomonas serbica]
MDAIKKGWIDNTFEAIESCEQYLKLQGDEYDDFRTLANWIYFTNLNAYLFMPVGWEAAKHTARDFSSFLHVLHLTMIKEGNWCIVEPQVQCSFLVLGVDVRDEEKLQALVDKKIGLSYRRPFLVHQDVERFIHLVEKH